MARLFAILMLVLVCTHANCTEAETKRLAILKAERHSVEIELAGERSAYPKAAPQDRAAIMKRIAGLQRDIKDLDTEINNTGKMPVIAMRDEQPAQVQKVTVRKNVVEGLASSVEAAKVVEVKRTHAEWDVFKNF